MARTPDADRSKTIKPDEERRAGNSDDRSGRVNPADREPGGPQSQQGTPQDREFAPGEDGECH